MNDRQKAEWADTEVQDEQHTPSLWNPAAAANWSLLFSPVFGAALHMQNWRALGDEQKAKQARTWMLACLVTIIGMMAASFFLPESKDWDRVQRSIGIGLLFGWYFTAARPQQNLVKERFGKDYKRKGWLKPIGFALLAVFGLFCVFLIAEVVVGS